MEKDQASETETNWEQLVPQMPRQLDEESPNNPASSDKEPSYNFRKYDQDQNFLVPLSIRDWIPDNSYVRFLDAAVNRLEKDEALDAIYSYYRKDGSGASAYHPKMMVKIIFYGVCNGILSSRKLARLLEYDVNLRYLSGNQLPDFRTICKFRDRHNGPLDDLFVDILELCSEAGLVTMGRVALDGTKMKANASLEKNFKREILAKKIKKLMEEAKMIDEQEDKKFGSSRGDELPDNFQSEENQLKIIDEAMKRLAEAKRKQHEKKTKKQKAAIETRQLLIPDEYESSAGAHDHEESEAEPSPPSSTEEQVPNRHDLDKLERLLDAYDQAGRKERKDRTEQQEMIDAREREEAETGKKRRGAKLRTPEEIKHPDKRGNTTDPDSRIMQNRFGGYTQAYNCQAMADTISQVVVAKAVLQEENDYHQAIPMLDSCRSNTGRLPGQALEDAGYWTDEDGVLFYGDCELFMNMTKDWKVYQKLLEEGPPKGRIPKGLSKRQLMERKMLTKRARGIMKYRFIIESVFGQRTTRGQDYFLRRGLEKVSTDWSMICSSGNMMKLYNSGNWSISHGVLNIEPAAS